MRKSTTKQQSQVQTIQRLLASRNVTQINGNINKTLERQSQVLSLMPEDLLLLFITSRIKTSVWKTRFVFEYFDTVQSQSTRCFALVACSACCSLGDAS